MEASFDHITSNLVSVPELKRLLHEIKEHRSDISVRVRILGQMWQQNFSKVYLVADAGVVLIDEKTKKTEIINSIDDIVQFEIDSRFQLYQPYNHYTFVDNKS